ncbi:hypothetical protein EVG20_g6037 [Dentipellis fragilis]|uniref:Sensitive to high expression protein 9, mitochondrial n=1 Tax=Dentipellis fragilis TaxID=205917 RepID=A0A4Y9YNK5_9AGAM|nr:hypothetical protein EVG20_g6037 [Dentipellis fragilis]
MLRAVSARPPILRISRTSVRWLQSTRPIAADNHASDNTPRPTPTPSDTLPSSKPPNPLSNKGSSSPSTPHIATSLSSAKEFIREWSEHNAIALRQRTDGLMAQLSSTFSQLGGQINRVTGYGEIEALKRRVVEQEARIDAARASAREAKVTYERAVQQRSNSQREVNDLLQRKHAWTDTDVSRFTGLVRQDHLHEQEEARAKAAVENTETKVEEEFSELTRCILGRYHEEQVWSDKIRSVSTYGSLAVLGINVLVFILAIILVEPWKRRRLIQAFERKVDELTQTNLDVVERSMKAIEGRLEGQDGLIAQLLAATAAEAAERKLPLADKTSPERTSPAAEEASPFVEKAHYLVMRDREMAVIMTCGAFAAGLAGWLARGLPYPDILPLRPGHTLIIPKTHYARVSELPTEFAAALGQAVSHISHALTQALDNTALNIVCNQEYAQAVHHVHYHVIPAPKPGVTSVEPVAQTTTGTSGSYQDMLRKEFEARHELVDDEAETLLKKIVSRL